MSFSGLLDPVRPVLSKFVMAVNVIIFWIVGLLLFMFNHVMVHDACWVRLFVQFI